MASDRDSGDDDEFYEPDDLTDLHQGIVNNDLDLLRQVLEAGVDPNEKFSGVVNPQHEGMTPLALASALDKIEAVKLLLTYQANVNDTFASLKTTALMTSSFHGHSEIVRILLKKGADVRAVDLQGSTALGYAFGGARTIEVIHQLLRAKVDVNQKNMLGMNALLLVAGYGNDVLAKMILDAGADANATNDFGHSALHLTVVGKRSQIKKLTSGQTGSYGLNRRNIDVALKEWARLHRDTLRGSDNERELEKVGEFMMNIGSKLDEREHISDDDNEAMKRRVEAVWRHRQDKIQSEKEKKKPGVLDNFLSCGGKRSKQVKHSSKSPTARPFVPLDNDPGRSVISPDVDRSVNQISDSCSKILRMIIDSGCEIDKMEKTFGMTALDMAILLGDVESTAVLVAAGGDSNHLMKMFALTDLYEAIAQLDKKQVKELLTFDSDIDVNQPFSQFNITRRRGNADTDNLKSDGLTPLTVAAQMNEVEVLDIMKMLQKQGADINKVGPGGSYPLAEACRTGNLKMVQFLVSQGSDIEIRCPAYKDATPVTIAAMSGHRLIVEFLLSKAAKVNIPMSDGRSALIKAVENSDWEMVELLFNANLLDNFSDHNSFTYEMAEKYQRPDRDFDLLKREIMDEARRYAERDKIDNSKKNSSSFLPASTSSVTERQNHWKPAGLDDQVPLSQGRSSRIPDVQLISEQQRQRPEQQKQFKQQPPKPPSPEESSEEEESEEEEEEEQHVQPARQQPKQQQQQPKQVQQQQPKQQKQQHAPSQPPPARPPPPPAESSSEEEDEDEEDAPPSRQQIQQQQQQRQPPKQQQQQPRQQQQQPKQQQQQQQQQPKQLQKEPQIRQPLPPERSDSEEEETESEEEEEEPKQQQRQPQQQQQQQQQRQPPVSKAAPPAAAKAPPQKKQESSEEDEDDDESEEEEEEVKSKAPAPAQKQVLPTKQVVKPSGNQPVAAKPAQKHVTSSEEEEDSEEEEEESEEEEVKVLPPQQRTAVTNILPSAKFENRSYQPMANNSSGKAPPPARPNNVQTKPNAAATPTRAPGPAAASVRSPMSPSGPPPPLPATGPPSDSATDSEEEEEDEEWDEDEDFEENHVPVGARDEISSPAKSKVNSTQSTVTSSKTSGGVVTRTVVTKTVVSSNVVARNEPPKGRPNMAKVEDSEDDDDDDDDDDEDEEEESDESHGRVGYHSTETDI